MNLLRLVSAVLVSSVMVGCASTPKPTMTEDQYKQEAAYLSTIYKCVDHGWLTPEIAATGITQSKGVLSTYIYDPQYLQDKTLQLRQTTTAPTQVGCNQIAITVSERKQQIADNHRSSDEIIRSYNELNNVIRTNTPKTTYCDRYGTTTTCNTY